ncbi:hypothetical protein A9Q99_07440 [Gammaproteobacteria bacterium 45_16_T64]|nr:hypothetical protein A9Q99_07440 [Gammaproteobacteria bacterium 45_16_T64]
MRKVLVVDDHQANRIALTSILRDLEVSLFYAASGSEALKLVLHHNFAVILMDVNMPLMDGIETTEIIHSDEAYKNLPIVMVTAADNSSDALRKAYEAGAIDFVYKPIEPEVLLSKVSQFVELETARINAEANREHLKVILDSAGEGVLGLTLAGDITFANPKAEAILGLAPDSLCGTNIRAFIYSSELEEQIRKESRIFSTLKERNNLQCDTECWFKSDGTTISVEYTCESTVTVEGSSTAGVLIFQDITLRKLRETREKYLANFDSLTGLANRTSFYEHLNKSVSRAKRSKELLSVIIFDVDHFKCINDTYGHHAGDTLLREIGQRVSLTLREGDVVARLGGDEFGIILYDISEAMAANAVAHKVIESFSQSFSLNDIEVDVSLSVGVAIFDNHSMTSEELVRLADTAMYQVKHEGRNGYRLFESEMMKASIEKRELHMLLQRAIANQELYLVYQPKIAIDTKKMIGGEALLRWKRKDGQNISPAKFIPIAEESGQIIALGDWVLNEACKQVSAWGKNALPISINVSVKQLLTRGFSQNLEASLVKYRLDRNLIEIEVTETGSIEDQQKVSEELQKIHDMGIRISIDDFGTGHASLDYLRKLPFDVLKIDRSFVKDIGLDEHDEEIIRVIMAVANTMGLDVIAEGAETLEQLQFLSKIDCHHIQGYYFSAPLSVQEYTLMLKDSSNILAPKFSSLTSYLKTNVA